MPENTILKRLNEMATDMSFLLMRQYESALVESNLGHPTKNILSLCLDAEDYFAARGISARVAMGMAAWRVGDGPFDVVQLNKTSAGIATRTHAWLVLSPFILDVSTFLMESFAKSSTKDGDESPLVLWRPDFLLTPASHVIGIEGVYRSKRLGTCSYVEAGNLTLFANAFRDVSRSSHKPKTHAFYEVLR